LADRVFPNQLRRLREARGLSLEALARKAGTTNPQISHLELGRRRLTVDWLLRLASALQCHPWEIVEEAARPVLGPEEAELLSRFRGLEPPRQAALLQFLRLQDEASDDDD